MEREFDIHRDITSATDTTTTEDARKNISQITRIETGVTKTGEIEAETGWVSAIGGSASGGEAAESFATYSVILSTLFLVGEYGVGLARFFKFRFIASRFVRVLDMGKFTESLFYFLLRSVATYTEYLIVVFHPVRNRKRFNLDLRYRLPLPALRYNSLDLASLSFVHAS